MNAEKVLRQVAALQGLSEEIRRTRHVYAATADDPNALIASPEWRAYEKAQEAWDDIADGPLIDSLLELKRAAVEWAIDESRGLEFQAKQSSLIELALVVLEVVE